MIGIPTNAYRSHVRAGELFYAWSPAGVKTGADTFQLGPSPSWITGGYHAGCTVPRVAPGRWTSPVGPPAIVEPDRDPVPATHLAYGATVDDVEAALQTGDVGLAPGVYHWPRPLRCTADRELRGYGAYIHATESAAYRSAMFYPARRFTLRGVTLFPFNYVFHSDEPAECMTLEDVTLVGGSLGFWPCRGLYVHRCEFHHASAGTPTAGLWHQCRWRGTSRHGHAFIAWKADGLAVVDCVFDATDRGVGFVPHWGPCSGALILGNRFRDIDLTDNGNEVLGCEGHRHPVADTLYLHNRVSNCAGPVFQVWDSHFERNVITDLAAVNSGPIIVSGMPGFRQVDNTFAFCELLSGGGVFLGRDATRNRFRYCHVSPAPGRWNQFDMRNVDYAAADAPAFEAFGAGNVLEACSSRAGTTLQRGFRVVAEPATDATSTP